MRPEEARKLLGGYATGSLTADERQALFEAALHDQELFAALADEEALRDLLADEAYRSDLAAALAEPPASFAQRFAAWWRRPASLVWAGSAAAVIIAAALVYQIGSPPQRTEVAMVSKGTAPAAPAPAPTESASARQAEAESVETFAERDEPVRRRAVQQPEPNEPAAKEEATQLAAASPSAAAGEAIRLEIADAAREGRGQSEEFRAKATSVSIAEQQQPPPPPAKPAPAALALRTSAGSASWYTVERLSSDGSWSAVPTDVPLSLSDRVRLSVLAPSTGILTLTDQATGEAVWNGPVTASNRYAVPPQGSLPPPAGRGFRRLLIAVTPPSGGGGGRAPATVGFAQAAPEAVVITLRYE